MSRNFNKLKRAVIKEELVALTGDMEKAVLLNQLIYWSERIRDFDSFIDEEKKRAEESDSEEVNVDYQNGWIYKDMEELKEEVMFTCSISTISRKLNDLRKAKWIDRRNNPKYKWDKRYQYRVNLNKIAIDLFDIGYMLQDYKVDLSMMLENTNLHNECSKMQDEASITHSDDSILHDGEAISEITTETTLDITNHQSSLKQNEGQTDFKNILDKLDLYTFEESKAIEQALRILYYSDKPLRLNNMNIPTNQVREDMERLTSSSIESALWDFKKASEGQAIGNVTSYLSRCIYNSIFDDSLKIEANLRYNKII